MRAGLGLFALASLIACRSAELRVEPTQGDSDGGELVRLVGADFLGHGPVVVYFGMRSARAVVIEDDAHIAVKTPEAEAFGPVDVRVEFADGTTHTLPAAYTYVQVDSKPLKPIFFKPGAKPVPT
ncbi:MAG TPA: IPT/TIG domain-containing protein, partial [Nannocystis sp.]